MEKLDIVWRIAELVIAIVGASIITRVLTIRARVRQENADANKKDEEVKTDQIENIKKIFIDLYQPVIDDLENRLERMGNKIDDVEKENGDLKKRMAELEEENGRLRKENEELRDALREIRPDVVPSKRSINAKNQARGNHGQFVKKIEGDYNKIEDNYDKSEK